LKQLMMIFKRKKLLPANPSEKQAVEKTYHPPDWNRREIIKSLVTLPVFGGFVFAVVKKMGWESYETKHLQDSLDAVTGATVKSFNYSKLKDLNLAEKCGINCFLTNPVLCEIISEYWKRDIGKIQFISDCAYKNDVITGIKMSIDNGAHSCYVQGGIADQLVKDGKLELMVKALELIRQNGLSAGIGAHALETVKACVDYGLKPDYWVKTLHPLNYWSAKAESEHDNIWCANPEETIAYMQNLEQPWIAFKTLAAGAIKPEVGFQYAFKNGADFICVGMYDFQIVDDVNIALDALADSLQRDRRWIV
jgi:hypothetical protein